nr:MAG TPA: hypothetical protein [Caudoviricetes sp.]
MTAWGYSDCLRQNCRVQSRRLRSPRYNILQWYRLLLIRQDQGF